jgi:membrane-associated phospholipid phosphatase
VRYSVAMWLRRLLFGGLVVLGFVCVTLPVRAEQATLSAPDDTPRLHWQSQWKRFGMGHYLLTGVGFSLAITKYPLGPRGDTVSGSWWVDEDVRDSLRLDSEQGRSAALNVSNVTVALSLAYPYFDAAIVAGLVHDSPDVALQMGLISTEVLAVTMAFQAIFNVTVSRERPYGDGCGADIPADSRLCQSDSRYFSFFSGHTSQAFAAAAVSCGHHIRFPLYGGGVADAAACAGAFAFATTTAGLRIAGDKHYFTDVLTGATVGTLVGFGLPWLLHYRHGPPDASAERGGQLLARLMLVPTPTGMLVQGAY